MRYLILKDDISQKELKSRQEYLYDVFKLYTIPYFNSKYVELKSLPDNNDIIFIKGHNFQVYNFLKKVNIKEKIVILITCYTGIVTSIKLKNKSMFYTDEITDCLNGKDYGFDYEITNSEINLYNCKYQSIEDKINYSFERIC